MDALAAALLAVVGARLAAVAYYPILADRSATIRVALLLAAAPLVLALPFLVPPTRPVIRWALAVDGAVILFKLWDLHLAYAGHRRPALRDYLAHVMAATMWNLSYGRRDATPSPPNLRRATLVAFATACFGLGACVILISFMDLGGVHFLLDHATKAVAAVVLAGGVMNLIALLRARITARPTLMPFDRPLLAATPAEFWRRWNQSVSQYLQTAIFEPAGGRRHPVRGLLVVFAASGLLHEYIYSVALMEVQGYQLAFFGVQGVAVVLTARVKPKGTARHFWRLGTWVFLLLTSILFFASNVNMFAHLITWHPHGAWLP